LLDINGLRRELKASMSLLFSRDDKSIKLAEHLFTTGKKLPLEFWEEGFYVHPSSYLADYQVFRPHLAHVQTRMKEWRPAGLSDLATKGYVDRMGWFTGIFGLAGGIIGVLSLVTSIAQIVLAVGAWKHPVPAPV